MKAPVFDPGWSDDVKRLFAHDMEEIWDRTIAPQMWIQYHNQLDLYQSLIPGDFRLRILDIGCAQATLALKFAEAGHEVVAMDLRNSFLEYAKTRFTHGDIQFITGNAFDSSAPIGDFDVVFANQIIEHVFDPSEKLAKLSKYLKANGRLIVTTPNWDYFINSLPNLSEFEKLDKSGLEEFTADADGHFFAYTSQELEMICSAAGFNVTSMKFFETPMISGHFKVRHLQRLLPDAALKLLDRLVLSSPRVREKLAHQLLIICTKSQ